MRKGSTFFLSVCSYSALVLFISFGIISSNHAQQDISFKGKVNISAGAEYSIFLEEKIRTGNADFLRFKGEIPRKPTGNPEVIATIDGINFDEDAANAGFYFIPPDPHGAAGPTRLVSVTNTSIEWHTKAGVQEASMRLGHNGITVVGSFFAPLMPVNPLFDPKVVFDQFAGRFVVVALERVSTGLLDDPGNVSRILVAVSDDDDPNGVWYYFAIASKLLIAAGDGLHEAWADYPGLAVDEEAVYITNNMFRFPAGGMFVGSRVWIMDKIPFYAGGPAAVMVYDHAALSGAPAPYPTTQPAHVFGPMLPMAPVGTFLVSAGWEDGVLADYLNVIQIFSPLAAPAFTSTFVPLGGDIFMTSMFPDAFQAGSAVLIETNDSRALNAVWRAGELWVANTVIPMFGPDMGQVTAHWYHLLAPGGPPPPVPPLVALLDQGNIGGEDISPFCYTFFPSIAVNVVGEAAIGFAASAPGIFAGAYYTGRLAMDPPGYTIPSDVVRPGLDPYVRTFGGPSNRWGDYSAMCVDPSDDLGFYVFNQYADTVGTVFGGEDGRWATAWGYIPPGALPVELSSFTAKLTSKSVTLNWQTTTETNNTGFEIERNSPSNKTVGWNKIGFVPGHGNSNSPHDYSFADNNLANVSNCKYRLKQIDSDGKFKYSNVIEVNIQPTSFELSQNYPNPFNPSTKISWQSPISSHQTLKIYDVLGNEVATLLNEVKPAGIYEVEMNAANLSSGVYYYKLQAGSFVETKKMLLLR